MAIRVTVTTQTVQMLKTYLAHPKTKLRNQTLVLPVITLHK